MMFPLYSANLFAENSEQIVEKSSEKLNSSEVLIAEGGNGQQTSNQRQLTVEEINNVKELLLQKPLAPYSVNLYGLLASSFNFVDTSRNNTPDFSVVNARAGIFVSEANWSGKLEVEFLGNQPPAFFPVDPVPPYLFLSQSATNTVTVRQAQINFDFWAHIAGKTDKAAEATVTSLKDLAAPNSYVSRLSIGGIRVIGAVAVGPVLTYSPSNYSRQDGIYLTEFVNFGKNTETNFSFGVFNTLYTTTTGPAGFFLSWGCCFFGTIPNFLGVNGFTSSSFSKAYLMNFGIKQNFGDTQTLSIAGFWGIQNNAAVITNDLGFEWTMRDVNHVEASALYNNVNLFGSRALVTGNGIGIWFEGELGSNQTKAPAAPVDFISFPTNDAYRSFLYGIGIGGDTSVYLSNIIKDADRFLYAAAMTFVDAKFPSHFSPNYTITQWVASLGYGYKTLELTLAASYATSPQTPFAKINVDSSTISAMHNNFKALFNATLFF